MSKKKKKELEDDMMIGYKKKRKKDKPPRKKRKEKGKWKKVKKILMILLKVIITIAIIAGIGAFLFVSPVFNITEIKVENASKISENTYISLSEIKLGENIFRINTGKIKEIITKESYVEDIEIERELPNTVVITVTERTPKYMIEKNGGMYMLIDKNGYYLEVTMQKKDLPIIRGILTETNSLELGDRLSEDDLEKFNDLIKIDEAINTKNIKAGQVIINIADNNDYILEFTSANKKVMLGDISNLSTKMDWIKYFIDNMEGTRGTIHLNTENVYFSPEE